MNKDMMNIDDFVREKLGGHTEKEDPAAWLRMKALLDKEMPEKAVPFVFRWGKPAAILGAALLIGALCAGGYKLSALREKSVATVSATSPEHNTIIKTNANTNNNTNNNNNNNTNTSDEHSLKAPGSLSPTNTTIPGGNNTAATTNPVVAERNAASPGNSSIAETQSARKSANAAYTGNKQDPSARSKHTVGVTHAKSGDAPIATTGTAKADHSTIAAAKQGSAHSGNRNTRNIVASNTRHTDPASGHTTAQTTETNTAGKPASGQHTAKAKRSSGTAKPTMFSSAASTANNKKEIAANKKKNRGNATAKSVSGEENHDPAKNKETTNDKEAALANSEELKDSISAISVVTRESTSRGGYPKKIIRITDTIAITKVPVTNPKTINNTIVSAVQPSKKTIKLAAAESRKANKLALKNEAERQKNIFASANKVELKENSTTKTAAANRETQSVVKVRKEKNGFSQWLQNLNLPEAVASAKQDFNSAQFYWGFTAGANYSLPNGSGSFQGVQFGPTGELVFNKHWSLFGAIKYFNRSGSKKSVNDNFASQIADQDSTQGANWFFTARTDSTNRYFNFSTVHSFEMPITLRYTIRKFYLMTGINLAYYLPVNVEKVEREYNNMNVHVITTNSTKPILNSTAPALGTSDFGARFGVGYVIGAGYQITPAWQADLRVTNLLWDNAKGEGAQKLSKDFYRLPSVQLSFGYQFNRIRNRATFGPNSAP